MTAMVRASGLRGYVALMRQLKADPVEMLRRYHIAPESLQDDEALVSLRATVHLLEASAAATACPDFGLRLSYSQDISVLGPLAIAMQNAPTVAQALDYASRYLFVHSAGLVLTVLPRSRLAREAAEVRFEIRLARQPQQRQCMDLCIGDLHRMAQRLAGERYALRAVTLPHAPLAPRSTYLRFFGAPVLFEQEHAGLHIARSTLDAGLHAVNDTLRQIAMDYLSLHFRAPGEAVSEHVRQALRRTLGTTRGRKTGVAELLGMHPRTLQRRLAAERTSFEAIREEVCKETALRYLCETRIPLSQLAGLLGLSEQSALARACRRWFGAAPSQLRRRASGASPPRAGRRRARLQ
jgi:AraC-like DNA-binding protein